jgi:hypothetical protein
MILQSYHCNNSERVGSHKVKSWMPNLHVLHFTLCGILYDNPMMVKCNMQLLLWTNILAFEALFKYLLLNVSPLAGQHTSHISWNPKVHINGPTPQPYTESDESSPQLHRTSLISMSILPSNLHLYHRRNKTKKNTLSCVFHSATKTIFLHCYGTYMEICNVRVPRRWMSTEPELFTLFFLPRPAVQLGPRPTRFFGFVEHTHTDTHTR